MPLLRRGSHGNDAGRRTIRDMVYGLEAAHQSTSLPACGHGACADESRSFFWRKSRIAVVFDDAPVCSHACLLRSIHRAIDREFSETDLRLPAYQHRIPLGLTMLSRRWITREQLTAALELQAKAGSGRLGEWLIRTQGVSESIVARALAVQWGVPVLDRDVVQSEAAASLLPRLLVDAFSMIPVRIAGRELLYVVVEDRVDRSITRAIQYMTGYVVEPAFTRSSIYEDLRVRTLERNDVTTKLFRYSSVAKIAEAILEAIRASAAASCRLTRIKDYLWLRTFTSGPTFQTRLAANYRDHVFVGEGC